MVFLDAVLHVEIFSMKVDSTRHAVLKELNNRGLSLWKFADWMSLDDLCCRNTITDWLTGKRDNMSVRIADLVRQRLGLIIVTKKRNS